MMNLILAVRNPVFKVLGGHAFGRVTTVTDALIIGFIFGTLGL